MFRSTISFIRAVSHWLFCQCWLAKVVHNNVLGLLLSTVVSLYYLMLDVWGDRWPILKDYQEVHGTIFCCLVAGTLGVLFWRAMAGLLGDSRAREYTKILEKLLLVIGKIVTQKCVRFQTKLREMKPTTNPFDVITQPEEQIRYILQESQHFFAEMAAITPEAVDASVMRRDPHKAKWHFVAITTGPKKHTKADRIMAEKSLARRCVDSAGEIFIADKKNASDNGEYFLSEKDRSYGNIGSAFCSPFWVPTSSELDNEKETELFVMTFVTYGAKICEPFDHASVESAKGLFREFVRRLEIECTLLAMKKRREHYHDECKRAKNNTKRGDETNGSEEGSGEQHDHSQQDQPVATEGIAGKSDISQTEHQLTRGNGEEVKLKGG